MGVLALSAKGGGRMTGICLPIKDKYALSIEEASEYFGIGQKKMRQLVAENIASGIAIQNGVKILVKRKRFEAFLDKLSAI